MTFNHIGPFLLKKKRRTKKEGEMSRKETGEEVVKEKNKFTAVCELKDI